MESLDPSCDGSITISSLVGTFTCPYHRPFETCNRCHIFKLESGMLEVQLVHLEAYLKSPRSFSNNNVIAQEPTHGPRAVKKSPTL